MRVCHGEFIQRKGISQVRILMVKKPDIFNLRYITMAPLKKNTGGVPGHPTIATEIGSMCKRLSDSTGNIILNEDV